MTTPAIASVRRRGHAANAGQAAMTTATARPAMMWLNVSAAAMSITTDRPHHARARSIPHRAIAKGTAAVSTHANIAGVTVSARSLKVLPRYGNTITSPMGCHGDAPVRSRTTK